METFVQALSAYIGQNVEVMVPNQIFEGTLTNVTDTVVEIVESVPVEYVPSGTSVNVAISTIDFVRILIV